MPASENFVDDRSRLNLGFNNSPSERGRTDRQTDGRIWEASRGWRIIAVGSRVLFAIRRRYQLNPSDIFTGYI